MAVAEVSPLEKPAQVSGRFYLPELDVLRFIAFAMVFLHHTLPEFRRHASLAAVRNCLASGVCLFFLLSAYLITELLDIEQRRTTEISLGPFYVRRMLRIWPLYFALIFADFFWPHHYPNHNFSLARLIASMLLVGNWYAYYHGIAASFSAPLWSISVEEQFYLLWPSVRKFLGRSGAVTWSIAMLLVSYASLWYLCCIRADVREKVWVNSFVQFQFFSSGALLAIVLAGRIPRLAFNVRVLTFIAGSALVFLSQAAFQMKLSEAPARFSLAAPGYLIANAGCILVFLSILGITVNPNSWLVYMGKISYGLYALHGLALEILSRIVWQHLALRYPGFILPIARPMVSILGFPLTLIMAIASYRFFELPFLQLKHRFERVRTRPD